MSAPVDDILDDLIDRVGTVRRWLLALGLLKAAALWLACTSLYIGLYCLVDHHLHFGPFGRLAALGFLVGLLIALSYYLIRTLRRDMTYSRAANHVESRQSFDQQLVAAVEYYEKGDEYPYSRGLARQLVLQVEAATRDFAFDSTVEKWRGYALAGCIAVCLSVVTLFVHQNIAYFSAYLSRLVRPFTAVAPVPTTVLRSITGDIVTTLHTPVTLVAEVEGRVPEVADLVLTAQQSRRIELRPTVDGNGVAVLTAAPAFDALGTVTYHFETPDARCEPHTVTVAPRPAIESITALISRPDGTARPREQKIENRTLEVLADSGIKLQIRAATPLREATISRPDEPSIVQSLDASQTFTVTFTADREMSLTFDLVGVEGLANDEPEVLRIALKADEPPQFELVSPEGDCLATDVASIPIAFEISDDVGLEAAQLCCELPSGETVILDTNDPQGAERARVTYTLELECYDLQVGDSILFYARASDVETDQKRTDANACSDISFVEIRPYRQYWHPQDGSPSNMIGPVPEDLITALEYTRAIFKKTWSLAQNATAGQSERASFETLGSDIEYCANTLATLRDDPESGFDDSTKATITEVIDLHAQAKRQLSIRDADAALPPERDAYRTLRKLVDELHMKLSPPSGQSPPQEKPERVTLREEPKTETPQDEQRIESQLEKAQQKIETLARQQESLKADLTKSTEQQSQSSGDSQSSESSSSSSSSSGQSSGSESESSSGQAQASAGQRAQGEQGREGDESAKGQPPRRAGADSTPGATGQGRTAEQGEPSKQTGSPSTPSATSEQNASQTPPAEADARMRMLEAKQKALREQASDLASPGAPGAQMALPELSNHAAVRDQARQRLDEAVEDMKAFEEALGDLRYDPGSSAQRQTELTELADAAVRDLAEAGQTIERGLSAGKPLTDAEQAEALARQLAEDAEALDESVGPEERAQMAERLKAAEALLERLAGTQWATVSGGRAGSTHVYTRGGASNQVEAARLLAQQFWSIAIQARNRQVRPIEDEPSDVEFFEVENEFFENAAKFKPPEDTR